MIKDATAGRTWAERVYPQLADDPLLMLQSWVPTLGARSVSILADAVLGHHVTPEEVHQGRHRPPMLDSPAYPVSVPTELARALRQLIAVRNPRLRDQTEAALVAEAVRNPDLSGLAAMRMLVGLRAWQPLDAVLAPQMHLAAQLTDAERQVIVQRWPREVPAQWPSLARVRSFIGRSTTEEGDLESLLSESTDFLALFSSGKARPGSLPDLVRKQMAFYLTNATRWDPESSMAVTRDAAEWLSVAIERIQASHAPVPPDDIAMINSLAGLVSTVAVSLGELPSALRLAELVGRLISEVDPDYEIYPTMVGWASALNSMASAVAGLTKRAQTHMAEYDHAYRVLGCHDYTLQRYVELAKAHLAISRGELDPTVVTERAMDADVGPQQAYLEALHILLAQGPQQAAEWLQGTVIRASWYGMPQWSWWPAHYVLILLHAQAGRIKVAESWLDRALLPEYLGAAVRACVDYSAGRTAAAIDQADAVLNAQKAPRAWRLVAVGAKIAALTHDPARDDELQALLISDDWSSAINAVALFPEPARTLVIERLPKKLVAGLPGLRPLTAPAPAVTMELTPRQLEVLGELSSDATMPDIARRMYLSPETVRSTAKQLYRRMGVHDRRAAVDLGRSLGLI